MAKRKTSRQRVGCKAASRMAVLLCGSVLCLLPAGAARADQQAAQPNAVRRQLNQPPPSVRVPAAPAQPQHPANQAPAPKPVDTAKKSAPLAKLTKTAPASTSPVSPKLANAAAPKPHKTEKKETVAGGPSEPVSPVEGPTPARRDPFSPLFSTVAKAGDSLPEHLPPGKAGLVIGTLHIDGIVSGPNGMIAIVSNAQDRVYFLREGDRLYDGSVEHIALDTVSFHETGKDPFGKPVEREISKALTNPSLGEAP